MPEMKIVVFRVGGQDFAADIHEVKEVIRPPVITPLPHPTPPLVGVFNLRGSIVTALDGSAALGIPGAAPPARTVIFQVQGRTVGLLVEAANNVVTVEEGGVRPPPDTSNIASKGIVIHNDRPIVLLDIPALIGRKPTLDPRPSP